MTTLKLIEIKKENEFFLKVKEAYLKDCKTENNEPIDIERILYNDEKVLFVSKDNSPLYDRTQNDIIFVNMELNKIEK